MAATPADGPLDQNRAIPTKDAYHMRRARANHARVQSDTPKLMEERFVSSYEASSSDLERISGCNGHCRYGIVECVLVSVAQLQDTWETYEYGRMIPTDEGRCTPLKEDKIAPGYLQFNGDHQQSNIGPFVDGGNESTESMCTVPKLLLVFFPEFLSGQIMGRKDRTMSQQYQKRDILSWVPLDDVVGITSIKNPKTGHPYANFMEWSETSDQNIEFKADIQSGRFEKGLVFWQNPTDPKANEKRAERVIEAYTSVLANGSSQIPPQSIEYFRPLPSPKQLAAMNPPCYYNVPQCGNKPGCKRVGYAQICQLCAPAEKCDIGTFQFPVLEKAHTVLSDEETKTPTSSSEAVDDSRDNWLSCAVRMRLSIVAVLMIILVHATLLV
ncbi:unnamed protein product [Albugo candida]|uniref:Uncharacterized protein n=1 Tax=Albugo candida TaxID=65357 RepID=A0A024GMG7_9STRA|nr:unnamed protein product [Albugo candida]|eukprot:CCI47953.1 unnamed protein product [Albugo candida]